MPEPDVEALEAEVRRRAARIGIRREDLPEDPSEALELLPLVRSRTASSRRHQPPARRRRPEPLPVDPSNIGSGTTPMQGAKPPSVKPGQRPAKGPAGRGRPPKAPGRRSLGGGRVRREAAQAARAATAPAWSAGRSVVTLLVWSLGLLLAYQLLQSADAVARLLQTPGKAVAWLSDPTRSIPYAPTD